MFGICFESGLGDLGSGLIKLASSLLHVYRVVLSLRKLYSLSDLSLSSFSSLSRSLLYLSLSIYKYLSLQHYSYAGSRLGMHPGLLCNFRETPGPWACTKAVGSKAWQSRGGSLQALGLES